MYLNSSLESCRQVSLEIFKSHSGKEKLTLQENSKDLNSSNSWSALIFIGGSKFRCAFIATFSTISLLNLASERFADINESEYIKTVKDFMREYCNLFAGKLKAGFELETDAYLSLPIITKNYDLENIFNTTIDNIEYAQWSIGEGNMSINIEFCFYEKEKFKNYDFIKKHLENDDSVDIDFF